MGHRRSQPPEATRPAANQADLDGLAAGQPPAGEPVPGPVFLVCLHGRRSGCCARYGGPLARALAGQHPGQVGETTHVGGHRFVPDLVILPHGLYNGPVDLRAAAAAIGAYRRGEGILHRFQGRADQDADVQAAEHAALARAAESPLRALCERAHNRLASD